MIIETNFDIGDEVYLKADPEQIKRIITEVKVLPNVLILYYCSYAGMTSVHYDFELNHEKEFVL